MKNGKYKYLLALLLCFSIGANADNVVSLSSESGLPNTEVTVSLSLANTDAITTLQLSIPLDENLSFVENSIVETSRLSSHSVTAGVKDGKLNIVVYSSNMSSIKDNSGELLSFRLLLGNLPTDISLNPSDFILVGTDGQEKDGSTVVGTISIRCAKAQYSSMTIDFGSVPIRDTYTQTVRVSNVGNEPLTITAVNFEDATFSTTATLPLTVAAGQSGNLNVTYAPIERGSVETQMKVVCNSISKLNTIQLKAQPFAVNELHVGSVSGVSDEIVTIPLTMNNMDDIVGFQLEFNLPNALEYVEGSFELSDRMKDHQTTVTLQDRKLIIVAYSPSGKAFNGNDGQLGSFDVKLIGRNGVSLKASEAILTALINDVVTDVLSANYGGYVSIQSPRISASNTLNFGERPVTEDVEQSYTIRNYGSAPLTVSRILFNDERFSVKESLPIEISQGGNTTITVVNSNKTAGSFSGTMQIYSNDPDQRLFTTNITGRVIVPNHLAFSAADTFTGDDVALTVEMDNYDAISGIQFDIVSTDEYTIDVSKVKLETRAKGLDLTIEHIDETTLRLVGYIMGGSIASGSGKVMTVYLTPTAELTDGTHQMTVRNMVLGDSDLSNKYEGPVSHSLSFEAKTIMPGDANGDKKVNVTDVMLTVSYIIGQSPANFIYKAADLNGDDKINVVDVVSIVTIILKGSSSNARAINRAVGTYDLNNDNVTITQINDQSYSMCLNNQCQYIAAQFDVHLSPGQTLDDIQLNKMRKNGHQLVYSQIDNNVYRVLIFTLGGQVFKGQDGELLTIQTSKSGDISIENIMFITSSHSVKEFAAISAGTTDIDDVKAFSADDIYTIGGRLVRKQSTTLEGLEKGIYIINKQKIIVK